MKICIPSSAGGHLIEILRIKEAFENYERFFITFWREGVIDEIKDEKYYLISDPERNPIKFIKCFFQTLIILLKEKPNIIISTGAGIAVPAIFLGKYFFRSKIIFIESFTRINKPSLVGKIVYPVSDFFFVQWKDLLKKYGDKAIYRGAVV